MMRSIHTRVTAIVATIAIVASVATPAFATTRLTIDGSTTLFPLASKWASLYKAAHGWSITVTAGGSGKGIGDARDGIVDIGMSSRAKQSSDDKNGKTMIFTPVARDGLVIVVSTKLYKAYPKYIYRISPSMVQKIYRGQVTNWKQVNGHLPNHAIDLVGRTGSSGTYTYFKQMFLTNQSSVGEIGSTQYKQSSRTRTYASNGSVRNAVTNDMFAIGYLSEAYVNSGVHPLNMPVPAHYYDTNYSEHDTPSSLVGKWVVPTVGTELNGTWKYVRPLYFVTAGSPSGNAATFINWCKSAAGQAYCAGQRYLKL